MLAVAIMYLHDIIEGCMEEGKLAKHHCGGDTAQKSVQRTHRLGCGEEMGFCWPWARGERN